MPRCVNCQGRYKFSDHTCPTCGGETALAVVKTNEILGARKDYRNVKPPVESKIKFTSFEDNAYDNKHEAANDHQRRIKARKMAAEAKEIEQKRAKGELKTESKLDNQAVKKLTADDQKVLAYLSKHPQLFNHNPKAMPFLSRAMLERLVNLTEGHDKLLATLKRFVYIFRTFNSFKEVSIAAMEVKLYNTPIAQGHADALMEVSNIQI